jgi:hypothetical protein
MAITVYGKQFQRDPHVEGRYLNGRTQIHVDLEMSDEPMYSVTCHEVTTSFYPTIEAAFGSLTDGPVSTEVLAELSRLRSETGANGGT